MVLLSQILVFIFGVSFWFASGNQNQRAIGATLGLAGQPFWFVITISAHQWFVMLLCCFYTVTWARMLWNNLKGDVFIQKSTFFRTLWRDVYIHVWYFQILGRRRSIRKDEDCDFYTPKAKPGRCQPYECWGDGHYECKSCLHYKPEPVSDELS